MPIPSKMPWSNRWNLAMRILRGEFNQIHQVQSRLMEEITLRNRNKEWYENRDAGKYPWLEPEGGKPEEYDRG